MGDLGNFNSQNQKPSSVFNQLPVSPADGWPMVFTASEIKATKTDAQSGYIEFTVQIIDGPAKGETGIYRNSRFSTSAKAVEIADRELTSVCLVTNRMNAQNHSEFLNIPFRGIVKNQKKAPDWKEGDAEFTEIKGFLHMDGANPGMSTGAASAEPAPTGPTATTEQPTATTEQPTATTEQPAWGQNTEAAKTNATPAWAQPK